jgi:hypothetical protein
MALFGALFEHDLNGGSKCCRTGLTINHYRKEFMS